MVRLKSTDRGSIELIERSRQIEPSRRRRAVEAPVRGTSGPATRDFGAATRDFGGRYAGYSIGNPGYLLQPLFPGRILGSRSVLIYLIRGVQVCHNFELLDV